MWDGAEEGGLICFDLNFDLAWLDLVVAWQTRGLWVEE
jgi:hypothetical protein